VTLQTTDADRPRDGVEPLPPDLGHVVEATATGDAYAWYVPPMDPIRLTSFSHGSG
jgi:hypothetical protein